MGRVALCRVPEFARYFFRKLSASSWWLHCERCIEHVDHALLGPRIAASTNQEAPFSHGGLAFKARHGIVDAGIGPFRTRVLSTTRPRWSLNVTLKLGLLQLKLVLLPLKLSLNTFHKLLNKCYLVDGKLNLERQHSTRSTNCSVDDQFP